MENRDLELIKHILIYCERIEETIRRYGKSIDVLKNDNDYLDSCALKIMQIGELANHLSDGFIQDYRQIPWHEIRAMRNIIAHEYGNTSSQIIWLTITEDIPSLKEFCSKIISTNI